MTSASPLSAPHPLIRILLWAGATAAGSGCLDFDEALGRCDEPGRPCGQPLATGAQCYEQVVLSDQPLAYWRFERGANLQDTSESMNHLQLTGTGADFIEGPAFPRGNTSVLELSGATYLQGLLEIPTSTSFTVEAWVRRVTGEAGGVFASVGIEDLEMRSMSLGGATLVGSLHHSANWPADAVQALNVDLTVWRHTVFVVQGSNLALYLDGEVRIENGSGRPPEAGAGRPYVGWTASSWLEKYVGSVDEVALYPSALSADRIRAHYVSATAPVLTALGGPCCGDLDCEEGTCKAGSCQL